MADLYENIARRTGGDIYIGVVGPVRSGKSTFIKKFMEALVIPNITDADERIRAIDELPQSAAGRTVMTTQPSFIPRQAVKITLNDRHSLAVRLVDCVGYMIKGAQGDSEEGKPRMVKTPWFSSSVPFEKAARTGTYKVISDHSTIGVVVTTDGSVTDIPRENYLSAEEKVITQLKSLEKPFVVVVNSVTPSAPAVQTITEEISLKYGVPAIAVNCLSLDKEGVERILQLALTQFDIKEVSISIPQWFAMQSRDFGPKADLWSDLRKHFEKGMKISSLPQLLEQMQNFSHISGAECKSVDYGTGRVEINTIMDNNLYYQTLQSIAGVDIKDEWSLMQLVKELVYAKTEYDKLAPALRQVETTGYGIVMPSADKLQLQEPEMVKQGSKYGIRFTASAPSLHIVRADITTTVSPIIGNEASGEGLVTSMLANFENNPLDIWQTNLFGNSLQELVNQGLNAKLNNIPAEAREKLAQTIERVVNEGCQGLICIIL